MENYFEYHKLLVVIRRGFARNNFKIESFMSSDHFMNSDNLFKNKKKFGRKCGFSQNPVGTNFFDNNMVYLHFFKKMSTLVCNIIVI